MKKVGKKSLWMWISATYTCKDSEEREILKQNSRNKLLKIKYLFYFRPSPSTEVFQFPFFKLHLPRD
jgi:hypothetical protein